MGDIIVISVILFFVGLAVRSMWKDHKKGGCAGCSGCSHSCGSCASACHMKTTA
jgi:hypothetical protein